MHFLLLRKHLQYFLVQPDLEQLQLTVPCWEGEKASGFFRSTLKEALMTSELLLSVLRQPRQLQPPHFLPLAKHSQYIFKHLEFLQLHPCECLPLLVVAVATVLVSQLDLHRKSIEGID